MPKNLLSIAVFLAGATQSPGQQYVVSTIAGGGVLPPMSPALSVAVGAPEGIATDTAGRVFFTAQNAVYRLDPDGTLTQVAGSGVPGDSGDGGPAVAARLMRPTALAVDRNGILFIADSMAGRVRKVTADGIITTIAGNGMGCCFNDGAGDGGLATAAQLYFPYQLAVDSAGDAYIGEGNTCRVRKIGADGIIRTVVGTGKCGHSGDGGPATSAQTGAPVGLAFDAADNLYIGDAMPGDDVIPYGTRIRKVSADGIITTIAGDGEVQFAGDGGPALSASFSYPGSVALDRAGNLYIADSARVRKVSPEGIIQTVAGTGEFGYSGDEGPGTRAKLAAAGFGGGLGVAVDNAGNLYLAERANNRVRKVTPDGIIRTVAGNGSASCCYSGDGGPARRAQFSHPAGVAVDAAGSVYVADTWNSRVRRVSPEGVITTVAEPIGPGNEATGLHFPTGLALDASGNLLIADAGNNRIRRLSPSGVMTTVAGSGVGGFGGDGAPATNAQLYWPKDVAVDATGSLYIADTGNNAIRKVSPDGIITTIAGSPAGGFAGDGGSAKTALFNWPSSVTVDSRGNVYVADTNNLRVRRITPGGTITTVADTNQRWMYPINSNPLEGVPLPIPLGIRMDRADSLYFTDGAGVRRIAPDGSTTVVAGNGTRGASGDGGPALDARVNGWGLTIDSAGNIYLADPWSNLVRVLQPAR